MNTDPRIYVRVFVSGASDDAGLFRGQGQRDGSFVRFTHLCCMYCRMRLLRQRSVNVVYFFMLTATSVAVTTFISINSIVAESRHYQTKAPCLIPSSATSPGQNRPPYGENKGARRYGRLE